MNHSAGPKRVFIVAGESSSDLHAAKIITALKEQEPHVQTFGVGGERMKQAGFDAIANAHDLSVMGFFYVLLKLPTIILIFWRLLKVIKQRQPQVALLLDFPDFNLLLARFLKARGIYVIYYISPQVWAWRASRVKTIKRVVDEMLCILPFEPAFYQKHQVTQARFVGHPLVEELTHIKDPSKLKQILNIHKEGPIVALLPGSRMQESLSLITPMLESALLIRAQIPQVLFLIPVAGTTSTVLLEQAIAKHQLKHCVTLIKGHGQDVLMLSDAAVVASGTATLEAALIGVPCIGIYKISPVTFFILSRVVRVFSILLANLILGKKVITELLQDKVNKNEIAPRIIQFLKTPQARIDAAHIRQQLLHTLTTQKPTQQVVKSIHKIINTKNAVGSTTTHSTQ